MLKIALPFGRPDTALAREDQDILSYVAEFGSITIAEAEALLPEVSRRSAQRHLKRLVDDGHLKISGEARDTRYLLPD